MEIKDNVNEKGLAMEMLAEIKAQSKRWMIAFFVVLALWACTIGGFVWFLNQYEFESYTQDGNGYNNINTGEQGDVINGTEVPQSIQEER
ncbi:MAG: hypothetical protein NC243_11250 [Lachnoclostridium sp.]|nr:hypothetical protein [Lachnoclostridium sp.]MCM1385104.1 hypothetical protein [Lachnoclostridium sp.]